MYDRTYTVDVPPGHIRVMGFNSNPKHFSVSWESRRVLILDVVGDHVEICARFGRKDGLPQEVDHILLHEAEKKLCGRRVA